MAGEPCGPYRVGLYEFGALYYRDAHGDWAGIDKDIIEELRKRTGCLLHTSTESRVRIWSLLSQGKLDISTSGISTPERDEYARFIPYLATRNFVLLRAESADMAVSMDAFLSHPELKVGVIRTFRHGAQYDGWLDKLRSQDRVYETADYPTLLRLFTIGRVQAILNINTNWRPMLADSSLAGHFQIADWAPRETVVGSLVLSRSRIPPEVAQRFEKALHEMREDGTLRAIYGKHADPRVADSMMLR
jgi:polar amino acid transport system substrate-binding protein